MTIYDLTILAWADDQLTLRISCSAGTYIRSIAHDLGELLGCGGHLTALRRTAVGSFTTANGVALDDLTPENVASHLHPADVAVDHLPALQVDEARWEYLQYGRPIPCQPDDPTGDLIRVYTPSAQFVGLVAQKGNLWRPHKLFVN